MDEGDRVVYEPRVNLRAGYIAYFTASKRSGSCERCGKYVAAMSPHRFWVDVDGEGHLGCTDPACTPTVEERANEVALWEPAFSDQKVESPFRMALRYNRVEMCSRCGLFLEAGEPVLYFPAEGGMGKDVLCESCGDWCREHRPSDQSRSAGREF